MSGVPPREKVQEQHDEEQEYYRMKDDHIFPWIGRWIDISEADCRGGHETEVDKVEPGMSISPQQVQSSVNDGKIKANFDVIEKQQQYRPPGRSGFVKDLGRKEKGRDIKDRFRQQIAGDRLDDDIRIPSRKQRHQRKDEFQQHIKFYGQLFIR